MLFCIYLHVYNLTHKNGLQIVLSQTFILIGVTQIACCQSSSITRLLKSYLPSLIISSTFTDFLTLAWFQGASSMLRQNEHSYISYQTKSLPSCHYPWLFLYDFLQSLAVSIYFSIPMKDIRELLQPKYFSPLSNTLMTHLIQTVSTPEIVLQI